MTLTREKEILVISTQMVKMLNYHSKNLEVKEQATIVTEAQDIKRRHQGKRIIKTITKIRVVETIISLQQIMTKFVGLNKIWNQEMKINIAKNKNKRLRMM